MYVYMYMYVYVYMYVYMYMYVCVYVRVCVCVYVRVRVYVYVHVHVDVHVYVYVWLIHFAVQPEPDCPGSNLSSAADSFSDLGTFLTSLCLSFFICWVRLYLAPTQSSSEDSMS